MKKLLVLILAFLYITGASGATVNLHYCMGQFAGWELGHDTDNQCSSCGMDKEAGVSDNCCRDEHKTVKLTDVHKSSETFVILLQTPAQVQLHDWYYQAFYPVSVMQLLPSINAPPAHIATPVFILTRSIRI